MIDVKREEVVDILDKMEFFQGQRAGRELWNDKPVEVQEMDLESFNRDIRTIRDYIFQLEETRQSGEWISMYDAFADTPYHNQNVLIKCDDGFICSARFLISDSGNNCGFYHKNIGFLQCPQVVAWMPYNEDMRGGKND